MHPEQAYESISHYLLTVALSTLLAKAPESHLPLTSRATAI